MKFLKVKISADIFFKIKTIFLVISVSLMFSCAPQRPPSIEYIPEGAKRGTASWYGPDFHGKPTASGEIYNMYDYTCAHKEYPFGTKLRVVNLNNNKDVVCTVNDRGPFIPGRDIDLSYAAAKKIGLIGPGVTEVLMDPVGRESRYVKYVKYSPLSGPATIQVGAFKEIDNALRLKQALSLRYDNVYIYKANVKGEIFYRVRVGKFSNYDEAYNIAKEMGKEGYKAIITKFEGANDEI